MIRERSYTHMIATFSSFISIHVDSVHFVPQLPKKLKGTMFSESHCRLVSEVNSGRRLRSTNVPTFAVPRATYEDEIRRS